MIENSTDVYDVVFPSPLDLQQLAAIAVAVKLWREQIAVHRSNNTLDKFDVESNISLDSVRPHLPSTILSIVEKYTECIQVSLFVEDEVFGLPWLLEILSKFDDIVCDVDGSISYDHTARRALLCEGIDDVKKFEIACRYCLEDDIMRIWPSVSNLESMKLTDDDFIHRNFYENSLLRYWICRLRNELHRIPTFGRNYETIDEHQMQILCVNDWSSIKYFWDRLKKVESRVTNALYILYRQRCVFCRYILAQLSEEELKALIARPNLNNHFGLLDGIFKSWSYYWRYREPDLVRSCILTTWRYVKHLINMEEFFQIVEEIFSTQNYSTDTKELLDDECFSRELWNSTPDHLKQWMFQVGLLERSFFEIDNLPCADVRNNWLLFAVLEDAPFEARSSFWCANWRTVLVATKPSDLQRLMNLCLKSKEDVDLFKKNDLSKYENIGVHCSLLMEQSRWNELGEFLNFCCLKTETNLALRMKCLNSHLSIFQSTTTTDPMTTKEILKNILPFTTFIDDTYCNDLTLAADFKNRFLSSPRMMLNLSQSVVWNRLEKVMEFVDTFVTSEQAAVDFKEHNFPPVFVDFLLSESFYHLEFEYDAFQSFMRWCFVSDDKIATFKLSIPVEDIVRRVAQRKDDNILRTEDMSCKSSVQRSAKEFYCNLDSFLQWYFSTPEEAAEFEKKFTRFEEYVFK